LSVLTGTRRLAVASPHLVQSQPTTFAIREVGVCNDKSCLGRQASQFRLVEEVDIAQAAAPEAQPRGPAIPYVLGRRSHGGGSSAPLRSAPRRGASRGWGIEGASRRPAAGPVPASTVSHGSEPDQESLVLFGPRSAAPRLDGKGQPSAGGVAGHASHPIDRLRAGLNGCARMSSPSPMPRGRPATHFTATIHRSPVLRMRLKPLACNHCWYASKV